MSEGLAFLSTGDALAITPLADGAAADGASFELRQGWEVPARFAGAEIEAAACREAVGWADASHLPKWELQGPVAALDALEAMPALGDGLAVPNGGAWWCRATPERALVIGELAAPDLDPAVHLLDLRSQLAGLRIAGPHARETLARFCALDLRPTAAPPRAFRPGSVARTPGYVLCEEADRYLVLFGAAYGTYMWEVIADAGARLGGCPVGVDAIAEPSAAVGAGTEEPSHA